MSPFIHPDASVLPADAGLTAAAASSAASFLNRTGRCIRFTFRFRFYFHFDVSSHKHDSGAAGRMPLSGGFFSSGKKGFRSIAMFICSDYSGIVIRSLFDGWVGGREGEVGAR